MGVSVVEFQGTQRFRVLRRIGAGGMGVVYAAHDRERDQVVALKTILRGDYETLFRLKREFRALAELAHPNLVALYDLFVEPGSCFFTMELLEGGDILSYVRGTVPVALAPTVHSLSSGHEDTVGSAPVPMGPRPDTRERPSAPAAAALAEPITELQCDEAKLRGVLPQLARGLLALHEVGKIHRDVKPSNIHVTPEGRVVLLDFGLVTSVAEAELEAREGQVVGTISYMAPEQAMGDARLTPAVDWYGMGAVLYEALTGRVPFRGPPLRVLEEKQRHAPAPPRAIVPRVPKDLDDLCVDLLSRDARERPSGPSVLRRLGGIVEDSGPLGHTPTLSRTGQFSGREAELRELDRAWDVALAGSAVAVTLSGPSGIGKSSVVARFLDRVRMRDPGVVVLSGRCYERERVPYRAIDSLIDHLSSYWLSLPREEAKDILPREAGLLPTLFPVLGRVPVCADAEGLFVVTRGTSSVDPQELRTRAFGALRELLQRIAARHRLVLFLDDMQWVDANTIALLSDIMRPPDPPPLLLLFSGRDESTAAAAELVRHMDAERRTVRLGPLPEDDAVALARRLLGDNAPELVSRITREAAGSPFFLLELARHVQGQRDGDERTAPKGLEDVLLGRIGELPAEARALLEVVAIAGEPISQRDAALASQLSSDAMTKQTRLLRAQHLLRAAAQDDHVEPYHDRIRETIAHRLSEERRRAHHRAIAIALTGHAPAERLARHFAGGGEPLKASEYARQGAEQAIGTLDFDRAAELYRMALELGQHDQAAERVLRTALGEALTHAGRPADASEQFKLAARGADRSIGLDLRRRSADALLRGGYVEEGLEAIRGVLGDIGLRLARTPMRALFALLVWRLWLRVRGLGFRPRALTEITTDAMTPVDVCETVALGLSMVDVVRSTEYGARYLAAALKLGEPSRVSKAMSLEAIFLAAQADVVRARWLVERVNRIAEEHDIGVGRSLVQATRAFYEFFCNSAWRRALEQFNEAAAYYRGQRSSAGFEIDTVELFTCWSLTYLGELAEVGRRVPAMVRAAERRGNRYAAVTLRCGFQGVWLVRDDDVTEAERDIVEALASWAPSRDSYHIQHLLALYTRTDLCFYAGDWQRARKLLEDDAEPLRRSLLERPPLNGLLVGHQRAKVLLAQVAGSPTMPASERRALLARAAAKGRWMARHPLPLARAQSWLVHAGVAAAAGDDAAAVEQLRSAVGALEALDTHLWANAARRRLGQTLGGDEGAAHLARADAWMAAQGIKSAPRITAMLVPGWE